MGKSEDNSSSRHYQNAVSAIKDAILHAQYEAARGVNNIQLMLYFAIGKFISMNTRKGK